MIIFQILFLILFSFIVSAVCKNNAPSYGDCVKARRSSQIANFMAGGIAGTLAAVVTSPLEIIKTQLQASKLSGTKKETVVSVCEKIYEKDGLSGFTKGLKPMLFGIVPTRAIYFWSYTATKDGLSPIIGDNAACHLLSAFNAGVVSNTITNPLWMIKTRFQLLADEAAGQTSFSNYQDVVKHIHREEGFGGFFRGLSASYVGCLEGGVQWVAYEYLKTKLKEGKGIQNLLPRNGLKRLSSVFATKKVHENTRMAPRSTEFMDEPAKMGRLVQKNNNWLKNVMADTNSKSNNISDQSKPQQQQHDPTTLDYFMAASLAKMVAVITTYPHEVIRTRMREQASNGAFKYNGFLNTFSLIAKEEGMSGLYGGMGMHLLRSVPNAAIMFVTFECVNNWLNNYYCEKNSTSPASSL